MNYYNIQTMVDIFISYAHEDEERVKNLVEVFEKQGWSVFWDRRIPAGKMWRNHIGVALHSAKCVIVAWSNHSIGSKWVTEEADDALHRGVLVPVLLDSILPPIGFRSVQAADLVNWKPDEISSDFDQLISDIREVIETYTSIIRAEPSKISTEESIETPTESIKLKKKLDPRKRKLIRLSALVVLLSLLAFLAFKYWPFVSQKSETTAPSGVVFASKIEANGQAIDPGTIFADSVKNIYAVFRSNMAPPGLTINAESVIEGGYYAYLRVAEDAPLSKFGWTWYHNGEELVNYQPIAEPGEILWLHRWDTSEGGIFSNGKFSPGKYSVVILISGNPAMSGEFTIRPTSEELE